MVEQQIQWPIFGVWWLITGDTSILTSPSQKPSNIGQIVQLIFKDTYVILFTFWVLLKLPSRFLLKEVIAT